MCVCMCVCMCCVCFCERGSEREGEGVSERDGVIDWVSARELEIKKENY